MVKERSNKTCWCAKRTEVRFSEKQRSKCQCFRILWKLKSAFSALSLTVVFILFLLNWCVRRFWSNLAKIFGNLMCINSFNKHQAPGNIHVLVTLTAVNMWGCWSLWRCSYSIIDHLSGNTKIIRLWTQTRLFDGYRWLTLTTGGIRGRDLVTNTVEKLTMIVQQQTWHLCSLIGSTVQEGEII